LFHFFDGVFFATTNVPMKQPVNETGIARPPHFQWIQKQPHRFSIPFRPFPYRFIPWDSVVFDFVQHLTIIVFIISLILLLIDNVRMTIPFYINFHSEIGVDAFSSIRRYIDLIRFQFHPSASAIFPGSIDSPTSFLSRCCCYCCCCH